MNKTICKILDECQYYNVERKKFAQAKWKGNFLITDKHNPQIFDAFDCVEHDTNTNDEDFYFVPFFYLNEGKEKTLDKILKVSNRFINRYKEFLQKPNVWFLINDMWEPTNKVIFFFEALKKKYPGVKIVLVTANKLLATDSNDIIYSDTSLKRVVPLEKPIPYEGNDLYINLNRIPRFHRCKLIEELISNNLKTLGYNTLAYKEFSTKFREYLDKTPNSNIPKTKFDVLDVRDFKKTNPNDYVPLDKCKKSFVYITTETVVDAQKLFFSEKAYKPIAIGMPFMLLGNPGSLQDLQDRGFITFSKWWDETYDLDLPLHKRIEIITQNLLKVSQYSNDDLHEMRKEMQEILEHNLNLYKILKRKNFLSEKIRKFAFDSCANLT